MKTNSDLHLGKELKEMRLKAGLSQMEVAKALGYKSPQFVSNWERHFHGVMPAPKAIPKLAKLYKKDEKVFVELHVTNFRMKLEREMKTGSRTKKK